MTKKVVQVATFAGLHASSFYATVMLDGNLHLLGHTANGSTVTLYRVALGTSFGSRGPSAP